MTSDTHLQLSQNTKLDDDPEFIKTSRDPNIIDANGNSLLMLASRSKGYHSIIQLLLDKGTNIHHTNIKGETALHIAVGRQSISDNYLIAKKLAEIRILLDNGANANLPDITELLSNYKYEEKPDKLEISVSTRRNPTS